MTRIRSLLFSTAVALSSCCSLMQPSGLALGRISTTEEQDKLLLRIDDYGDGGDWEPRRSGWVELDMPTGGVEAASAAKALAPQFTLGNFTATTATTDGRWASVEEGPAVEVDMASNQFVLFTQSGNLYIASSQGRLEPLPKPSLPYLDGSGAARAYADHAIVALPLMCCVCQSRAHFRASPAGWQPLRALDDHTGEPAPAVDWRVGRAFRAAGKQADAALLLTRQNLSSGDEDVLSVGAEKARAALGWGQPRAAAERTFIVVLEQEAGSGAEAETSARLAAVAASIEGAGGTVQSTLSGLAMLIVEMRPSAVPTVEALPGVAYVEEDVPAGIAASECPTEAPRFGTACTPSEENQGCVLATFRCGDGTIVDTEVAVCTAEGWAVAVAGVACGGGDDGSIGGGVIAGIAVGVLALAGGLVALAALLLRRTKQPPKGASGPAQP